MNNQGNAYYDKGDYNRAIADFEAALRINPQYQAAKESLEFVKQKLGQSKQSK